MEHSKPSSPTWCIDLSILECDKEIRRGSCFYLHPKVVINIGDAASQQWSTQLPESIYRDELLQIATEFYFSFQILTEAWQA